MTLKEIALAAAGLLQADDVEALIVSAGKPEEYMSDSDAKCLILCADLAVKEAAADGFPIVRETNVVAKNKRIPLTDFPHEFCAVKSLLLNGRRAAFSVDMRGITVPEDGTYTVVYAETPREIEPEDDVVIGAFADKTMLGYLTARDYCLITGRTDEASIWDQRYATESERIRLGRRAALPARKWR